MLEIEFTAKFKRDFKKLKRQGKDISKLIAVLDSLAKQDPLPEQMHDHALVGNYGGHRECHIEPDWLLIYLIKNNELVLTAVRTGSHSDILGL
jgi:mRNA interferase YafQ